MIIKICKICKKNFKVSNNRNKIAKYCSVECRNIGYLGKHVSKKTEFKKGQVFSKERNIKISKTHQKNHKLRKRIFLICNYCKKSFETVLSHSRRRFCSKECRKSQTNLNNKQFKIKNAKNFREYKEKRGCTICGYKKYGGALDFHHINPEKKKRRIERNHFYSKGKLISKELKKCILVCKNCHYELHELLRRDKYEYFNYIKNNTNLTKEK